jgi:hypothetical protein
LGYDKSQLIPDNGRVGFETTEMESQSMGYVISMFHLIIKDLLGFERWQVKRRSTSQQSVSVQDEFMH